jgi:hypothetical protein
LILHGYNHPEANYYQRAGHILDQQQGTFPPCIEIFGSLGHQKAEQKQNYEFSLN